MKTDNRHRERLSVEIAELHARLEEAEDTLAAIRNGDVDALVVGDDLYTLDSANVASNRLRKDVLAQMADAVLAFDNVDHVIFMNPAAERQYGRSASEALGRPKADLYRESWPLPAEAARVERERRDAGGYRAESIHHTADGREIPVESTVSRLRDAGGAEIGSLAVVRDIGERVRAEVSLRATTEALARRERQFSTLVENSPDIFTRLDRELRHVYVSPVVSRVTGRPAADFLGKTHREVGMPEDLAAAWGALLEQVFRSGEVGRTTFEFATAGQGQRFFSARLIPEFAADGSVESVLSIASDITEQALADAALRESQALLQQADRRKDEFLATLAHELRNPLAPIRNALEIMRLSDDTRIHENARGIIERQLVQMVHLVDDLLDVSRITQGKVELRRERVDVASIVATAIETSRPLIDASRHELTVRLPVAGSLLVHGDVTRLCQIVANVLNNAAKYTPDGGRIEVAAERDAGWAAISVKDSGVGIPPDMLPRVFDMFAQIDRSLERSQGGLGIGLALVKRLVEMHGGSVEAQSDGQGRGCRFVLRLPLALPDAAADGARQAHAADDVHGSHIRVLVVDDNLDNAESLAQYLAMLGYETAKANDGPEAIRLAESFRPQAVVLDIGLPLLSGLDVARHLRAQPWGSGMLLIALSGWGQEEDRRKSREAGFDHHFVKPVDTEALGDLLVKRRAG
jgi:PAS domain S-box-containing protein